MSYLMDEYDYETDIRVQREEAAEEMRKEKELVEKKLAEVQKEAQLEQEKAQAALYEKSRSTAKSLLALKQFSNEQIAEIAGLSPEEVQMISEEYENR